MSEPTSTPAPADKTPAVTKSDLCCLRTLTYVSLSLNALILLLIIAGVICHHLHRHHHHGFGGRGAYADRGFMRGGFGGQQFHRFGGEFGPGQPWGGNGRFGGNNPANFQRGPDGMGGMMGSQKNPPDPAKMTDNILNHLTKTLTLTDDQKAKIKPIVEQQVAAMQKQMEAQRAAMQKQIADAKAQIRPLLTADQQKQLDAMPLPGQKPPDAGIPPPTAPPAAAN